MKYYFLLRCKISFFIVLVFSFHVFSADESIDGQRGFKQFGIFNECNLDSIQTELSKRENSINTFLPEKSTNNIVIGSLTFIIKTRSGLYKHINSPISFITENNEEKLLIFESAAEYDIDKRFKVKEAIQKEYSLQIDLGGNLTDIFDSIKRTWFIENFDSPDKLCPDYAKYGIDDFFTKKSNVASSITHLRDKLTSMAHFLLEEGVKINKTALLLKPFTAEEYNSNESARIAFSDKKSNQLPSNILNSVHSKTTPNEIKIIKDLENTFKKNISDICNSFWHSEQRLLNFLEGDKSVSIIEKLGDSLLEGEEVGAVAQKKMKTHSAYFS